MMSIRRWRALRCFVAVGALLAVRLQALADVVFESYSLERPIDADTVLAPVYAGLHARGILTHPEEVLAEIRGALPMPGVDNFDITVSDVIQRIDLGVTKARYGKNDEAIHLLERALEDLRNNPAMTVSLGDGRKWITKALAGLTRAYYEKGDLQAAAAVIAEHVRSFPEFPIDRGTYGPKLASLYEKTRAALDAQPAGRLLLIVDWADATIFVNEYERGLGGVVVQPFPAGDYRIMVRVGGRARRYRVRIEPGVQTELQINWYTDAAFVVSREWLGFVWPTGLDHDHELPMFVARVVRQHAHHGVLVLGIVRRGEHRYITARRFKRTTGEYEGGAAIELGPHQDAKIAALVRFLAAGDRAPVLLPLVKDPDPSRPTPSEPPRWPLWVATGTAASALAAGVYLFSLDGECRDMGCAEHRHTAGWGLTMLGIGTAAAAFAAYWYLRPRPEAEEVALAIGVRPGPAGGLLTLMGRF